MSDNIAFWKIDNARLNVELEKNHRALANSRVTMRSSARSALAERKTAIAMRASEALGKSSAPRMSAMSCAVTFRGLGFGALGMAMLLPVPRGAVKAESDKIDSGTGKKERPETRHRRSSFTLSTYPAYLTREELHDLLSRISILSI
jgi:hypothetical protein